MNATELRRALALAKPGDVVMLEPGQFIVAQPIEIPAGVIVSSKRP